MLPESTLHLPLTGLYLLSLLASDDVGSYATAVELISALDSTHSRQISKKIFESKYVSFVTNLARAVSEGRYNSIMHARDNLPMEEYALFLDQLIVTVREKIADSSQIAYTRYPLARANELLLLNPSSQKVSAYCATRGWTIKDGYIVFPRQPNPDREFSTVKSISQNLHYANELERIV